MDFGVSGEMHVSLLPWLIMFFFHTWAFFLLSFFVCPCLFVFAFAFLLSGWIDQAQFREFWTALAGELDAALAEQVVARRLEITQDEVSRSPRVPSASFCWVVVVVVVVVEESRLKSKKRQNVHNFWSENDENVRMARAETKKKTPHGKNLEDTW